MAKEKTILVNDPILGSGKKLFRCALSGSYKEKAFVVYKHDKAFVNVLAALYFYIAKFTIQDEKERKIAEERQRKQAENPPKKEVKKKVPEKKLVDKKRPIERAIAAITEYRQEESSFISRICIEFFSSTDASQIDWTRNECIELYPELNDSVQEYEGTQKAILAQKESEAKDTKTKPHSYVYHFSVDSESEIKKFAVTKRPQYVPDEIPVDCTYHGNITVEHNKKDVSVSVFCDEAEGEDSDDVAPLFAEYFETCDEFDEIKNYMKGDVYIWSEYNLKQIPDDTLQWRRKREEEAARQALEQAKKRLDEAREKNGKKRKAKESKAIKSPKKQTTSV